MSSASAKHGSQRNRMTTCADRQRQVLKAVEDRGRVSRPQLHELVEGSNCAVNHHLHWASLTSGFLEQGDDGMVSLGRAGEGWLIDNGKPSSDWSKEALACGLPALRDWQDRALRAWSGHARCGVVQAVTGTGKSRLGIEAIREALRDDFSSVVVVPTVDLVEQWSRALSRAKIDHGVTGDGKVASFTTHRVIIGTVQSLYLAPPQRGDGKVLIVADECHRYGATQWGRVLDPSYRRRLGLTATFERNDDGIARLLDYFGGTPVFEIGFRQAIAENVVAHYDVELVGIDLDAQERMEYDEAEEMLRDARLRLVAAGLPTEPFGEFLYEVQKAADYDEDPTIEDAARRYLKAFSRRIDVMTGARAKIDMAQRLAPAIGQSWGALLFTRRVDMAEEIAEALRVAGIRAAGMHSDLSRGERRERLIELRARRLQALVAPSVLDEGIDVPDVDLAVVLGGSKSRRQMIQRMGRVLRLKPDGRKATFIVVYARGTAEDLSRANGQEGCLDLIVDAADSVIMDGEPLVREADVSPSPSDDSSESPDTSQKTIEVPSRPFTDLLIHQIDAATLPITRRVLDDFIKAHGGSDGDAEKRLRSLVVELKQRDSRLAASGTPGVYVARGDGFALALAAERFVGYKSYRPTPSATVPIKTSAPATPSFPGRDIGASEPGSRPAPNADKTLSDTSAEDEYVLPEPQLSGPPSVAGDDVITRLERVVELYRVGLLNDEEFAAAKARLLF